MSATANPELLEGQARIDAIDALIRILDDAQASAEEQMAAQDKLDWFAREITEWFQPVGFKLLVYIPYLQAKMENGLYMTQDSREAFERGSVYARVIAVGREAYKDEKRYPRGAWCEVGDYVLMRAYTGTRFKRTGYPFQYALINDDSVDGVMRERLRIERAA